MELLLKIRRKILFPYFYIIIFFGGALSCSSNQSSLNDTSSLIATGKIKKFSLDSETKYNAFYLYPFSDATNHQYLSFLNYGTNQILFYDLDSGRFLFKINMPSDGPDGVVQPSGYYIKDFEHIYLTSYSYNGIIKIDTTSHIVHKIPYTKTDNGFKFLPSYTPSSHPYTAPYIIGNRMFFMPPLVDRFCPAEKTPLSISMDTLSHRFFASEITYSQVLSEEELGTNDTRCSRIFDGNSFIYSFYVDDEILVTSIDHKEFKKIKAESQHIHSSIDKQKKGSDGPKSNLEVARYGDLIHDKYRNVYYRFAYHKVELDHKTNWRGKAVYGRKKFSVIILDQNFKVIGETLFPESIYNSYVSFVNEEGLYISRDYQIGTGNQSEDFLSFELFKLIDL